MLSFIGHINLPSHNYYLPVMNFIFQIHWLHFIIMGQKLILCEIITQICVSQLEFYAELVLGTQILYQIKQCPWSMMIFLGTLVNYYICSVVIYFYYSDTLWKIHLLNIHAQWHSYFGVLA